MEFRTFAHFFSHGRLGGFQWWKALGLMAVSVIVALATSLRYGEPFHLWFVCPLVLLGAVGLLWWNGRSFRSTSEGQSEDDE